MLLELSVFSPDAWSESKAIQKGNMSWYTPRLVFRLLLLGALILMPVHNAKLARVNTTVPNSVSFSQFRNNFERKLNSGNNAFMDNRNPDIRPDARPSGIQTQYTSKQTQGQLRPNTENFGVRSKNWNTLRNHTFENGDPESRRDAYFGDTSIKHSEQIKHQSNIQGADSEKTLADFNSKQNLTLGNVSSELRGNTSPNGNTSISTGNIQASYQLELQAKGIKNNSKISNADQTLGANSSTSDFHEEGRQFPTTYEDEQVKGAYSLQDSAKTTAPPTQIRTNLPPVNGRMSTGLQYNWKTNVQFAFQKKISRAETESAANLEMKLLWTKLVLRNYKRRNLLVRHGLLLQRGRQYTQNQARQLWRKVVTTHIRRRLLEHIWRRRRLFLARIARLIKSILPLRPYNHRQDFSSRHNGDTNQSKLTTLLFLMANLEAGSRISYDYFFTAIPKELKAVYGRLLRRSYYPGNKGINFFSQKHSTGSKIGLHSALVARKMAYFSRLYRNRHLNLLRFHLYRGLGLRRYRLVWNNRLRDWLRSSSSLFSYSFLVQKRNYSRGDKLQDFIREKLTPPGPHISGADSTMKEVSAKFENESEKDPAIRIANRSDLQKKLLTSGHRSYHGGHPLYRLLTLSNRTMHSRIEMQEELVKILKEMVDFLKHPKYWPLSSIVDKLTDIYNLLKLMYENASINDVPFYGFVHRVLRWYGNTTISQSIPNVTDKQVSIPSIGAHAHGKISFTFPMFDSIKDYGQMAVSAAKVVVNRICILISNMYLLTNGKLRETSVDKLQTKDSVQPGHVLNTTKIRGSEEVSHEDIMRRKAAIAAGDVTASDINATNILINLKVNNSLRSAEVHRNLLRTDVNPFISAVRKWLQEFNIQESEMGDVGGTTKQQDPDVQTNVEEVKLFGAAETLANQSGNVQKDGKKVTDNLYKKARLGERTKLSLLFQTEPSSRSGSDSKFKQSKTIDRVRVTDDSSRLGLKLLQEKDRKPVLRVANTRGLSETHVRHPKSAVVWIYPWLTGSRVLSRSLYWLSQVSQRLLAFIRRLEIANLRLRMIMFSRLFRNQSQNAAVQPGPAKLQHDFDADGGIQRLELENIRNIFVKHFRQTPGYDASKNHGESYNLISNASDATAAAAATTTTNLKALQGKSKTNEDKIANIKISEPLTQLNSTLVQEKTNTQLNSTLVQEKTNTQLNSTSVQEKNTRFQREIISANQLQNAARSRTMKSAQNKPGDKTHNYDVQARKSRTLLTTLNGESEAQNRDEGVQSLDPIDKLISQRIMLQNRGRDHFPRRQDNQNQDFAHKEISTMDAEDYQPHQGRIEMDHSTRSDDDSQNAQAFKRHRYRTMSETANPYRNHGESLRDKQTFDSAFPQNGQADYTHHYSSRVLQKVAHLLRQKLLRLLRLARQRGIYRGQPPAVPVVSLVHSNFPGGSQDYQYGSLKEALPKLGGGVPYITRNRNNSYDSLHDLPLRGTSETATERGASSPQANVTEGILSTSSSQQQIRSGANKAANENSPWRDNTDQLAQKQARPNVADVALLKNIEMLTYKALGLRNQKSRDFFDYDTNVNEGDAHAEYPTQTNSRDTLPEQIMPYGSYGHRALPASFTRPEREYVQGGPKTRFRRQIDVSDYDVPEAPDENFLVKVDLMKNLRAKWVKMKKKLRKLQQRIYDAKDSYSNVEVDIDQLLKRGNALVAADVQISNRNKLHNRMSEANWRIAQAEFGQFQRDIDKKNTETMRRNKNAMKKDIRLKLAKYKNAFEKSRANLNFQVDTLLNISSNIPVWVSGQDVNYLQKLASLGLEEGEGDSDVMDYLYEDGIGHTLKELDALHGHVSDMKEDPDLNKVETLLRTIHLRNSRAVKGLINKHELSDGKTDNLTDVGKHSDKRVKDSARLPRGDKGVNETHLPQLRHESGKHGLSDMKADNLTDVGSDPDKPVTDGARPPQGDKDVNGTHLSQLRQESEVLPASSASRHSPDKRWERSIGFDEEFGITDNPRESDFISRWRELKKSIRTLRHNVLESIMRYTKAEKSAQWLEKVGPRFEGNIIDLIDANALNSSISNAKLTMILRDFKLYQDEIKYLERTVDRNELYFIGQDMKEKMRKLREAVIEQEILLAAKLYSRIDPNLVFTFSVDTGQSLESDDQDPVPINTAYFGSEDYDDGSPSAVTGEIENLNKYDYELNDLTELHDIDRQIREVLLKTAFRGSSDNSHLDDHVVRKKREAKSGEEELGKPKDAKLPTFTEETESKGNARKTAKFSKEKPVKPKEKKRKKKVKFEKETPEQLPDLLGDTGDTDLMEDYPDLPDIKGRRLDSKGLNFDLHGGGDTGIMDSDLDLQGGRDLKYTGTRLDPGKDYSIFDVSESDLGKDLSTKGLWRNDDLNMPTSDNDLVTKDIADVEKDGTMLRSKIKGVSSLFQYLDNNLINELQHSSKDTRADFTLQESSSGVNVPSLEGVGNSQDMPDLRGLGDGAMQMKSDTLDTKPENDDLRDILELQEDIDKSKMEKRRLRDLLTIGGKRNLHEDALEADYGKRALDIPLRLHDRSVVPASGLEESMLPPVDDIINDYEGRFLAESLRQEEELPLNLKLNKKLYDFWKGLKKDIKKNRGLEGSYQKDSDRLGLEGGQKDSISRLGLDSDLHEDNIRDKMEAFVGKAREDAIKAANTPVIKSFDTNDDIDYDIHQIREDLSDKYIRPSADVDADIGRKGDLAPLDDAIFLYDQREENDLNPVNTPRTVQWDSPTRPTKRLTGYPQSNQLFKQIAKAENYLNSEITRERSAEEQAILREIRRQQKEEMRQRQKDEKDMVWAAKHESDAMKDLENVAKDLTKKKLNEYRQEVKEIKKSLKEEGQEQAKRRKEWAREMKLLRKY